MKPLILSVKGELGCLESSYRLNISSRTTRISPSGYLGRVDS
jgi:hypothetical protein